MNGACNGTFFFCPTPWSPGEGPKGQISLNFSYKVKFKDFLTKLCVFSHMKDIKHIRRDFHLAAWFMPQEWDLGVRRGVGGRQIFYLEIQPDLVCELLTRMTYALVPFFGSPPPREGPKGQILNLNYKVNFKDF